MDAGAVGELDAERALALDQNPLDPAVLVDHGSGARGGDAQRRRKLAVVDLMILRTEHRAREPGRQMRLAAPRLGSADPFDRQPEPLLEIELMAQPRLI